MSNFFTNGDFETGDLTGWTDTSWGTGTHTETVEVTTGSKRSGTYGLRTVSSATGSGSKSRAEIKQTISGGFQTLSFWYKVNSRVAGTVNYIVIAVENQNKVNIVVMNAPPQGDWTEYTINKADIDLLGDTWVDSPIFYFYNYTQALPTATTEVFFDSFVASSVTQDIQGKNTIFIADEVQAKYSLLVPQSIQGKTTVVLAKSLISRWSFPYLDLADFKLQEITISKNIKDTLWNCSATLDEYYDIDLMTKPNVVFIILDHLDNPHALFSGIMPETTPEIAAAANKTTLVGHDYGWYLANQYVPSAYQHNTAGTNPATIITGLLGGSDWAITTNIEPYNINTVTQWGGTLASRVFDFDGNTTKIAAINKICDYCRYMFVVKSRDLGDGYYQPCGYFIDENDIDTELDLPAEVTFTNPDPYLDGKIRIARRATERYNKITVTGRDPAGTVFTKTLSSANLTAGYELPVEFVENSGAWTTQLQVDARCLELYNYYINPTTVFTATFIDRFDLELLQKFKFMKYTSQGVTEDWMRITSITYSLRKGSEGISRTVTIEFTTNQAFSNLDRMYRSNSPDFATETESIFDGKMMQVPKNEVGTVTAIDGNTATVLLEDGRTVTARIVS
jgi:hypothetical protein